MKTSELKQQVVTALQGDKESVTELLSFAGYDINRYMCYTYKLGYVFTPSAGLVDKLYKKITDAGYNSIKMYILRSKQAATRAAKAKRQQLRREQIAIERDYKKAHPFLNKEEELAKIFEKTYNLSVNGYLSTYYAVNGTKKIQDIKIEVWTSQNWDKARECKAYKWSTTEYNYSLQVPARYNFAVIGGLLTFWRGKLDRNGVKCSWIEQGRGVSNFVVRTGYLIKGEHIGCASLQKALKICAEHRAKRLTVLLAARRKKIETDALLSTTYCTFKDSIAAGNCMSGSNNFCNKLFADLGAEVDQITLADLRKYGKKYGVETYAERVITYKLSHI